MRRAASFRHRNAPRTVPARRLGPSASIDNQHHARRRHLEEKLDNRQFFGEVVFGSWASRTGLTETESALIDRFLDRDRSTLEGGTGAGRILFSLHERGFGDLHGFDMVPRLVDVAKGRDRAHAIDFTVQDAVALDYPVARFEQAIYLQQVLCFIEDSGDRFRAMREASRVLQPGGTALFSFLCYECRLKRPLYRAFARYLRVQRLVRHRDVGPQYQPWLKAGDKPHLGALVDRGPYVYWYRVNEALDALARAGFRITWVGSTAQVASGAWERDLQRLDRPTLDGMLYVACRK
jgi:SAM-dependent methyltransferase